MSSIGGQEGGFDYRRVFDALPDPAWVRDPASRRPLAVNAAALALFDCSRAAFLADAREVPLATDAEAVTGDGPRRIRLQVPGGGTRVAEVVVRPLRWQQSDAELVLVRASLDFSREDRRSRPPESLHRDLQREAERERCFLRKLLESGAGRYLVVTPETHRIVAVSESLLTESGLSREDLLDRPLFDVFPASPDAGRDDWAHIMRASLARVEETRAVDVMPLRHDCVPGAPAVPGHRARWSPVNAPVFVEPGGEIAFIIHRVEGPLEGSPSAEAVAAIDPAVGTTVDTGAAAAAVLSATELGHLHEQLRVSEARYREVFDELPLSIWVEDWSRVKQIVDRLRARGVEDLRAHLEADPALLIELIDAARVIDVSSGTVDLFRAPGKQDVIDAVSGDRIGDWEKEYFIRELVAFADGATCFQNDGRVETFDGKQLLVESTAVIASGSLGDWSRVLTLVKDVTAQRLAQTSLRESEERFRMIAGASADATWDWSIDGERLWWSEGLRTLFGYDNESVQPGVESWSERLHPEDHDRVLASLNAALESGAAVWSEEYRFRCADESIAWVVDRGHIIRDHDGRAVRMLGVLNDITHRRETEARRRQSQRLEAVGQLTGGVAHDFNNILTVVMGSAELIGELSDDPEIRALAEAARKAGAHGAGLTARLLAFARSQPMDTKALSPGGLLGDMRDLLSRSLGEDIEVDIQVAEDLWDAVIDSGQLEGAILNLAINARDAMPRGGRVAIEADNRVLRAGALGEDEEVVPGDYVCIRVSDTGTGMPPEVLARVFEPFFTTKEVGRGSGLGMSMVYGVVRQLGGHVSVTSEPGAGTEVALYLPRARRTGREAASGELESAAGAVAPGETPGVAARSERILLVEDEPLLREHVGAQLEAMGYQVVVATDGRDALERVAGGELVDLLFTDVVMPGGISGPELARAVRRLRPNLPVLLTSGYTGVRGARPEPGDEEYPILSKPYRRRELAARVREVLDTGG